MKKLLLFILSILNSYSISIAESPQEKITLLGPNLYKLEDITAHAVRQNTGKKFALILVKSHGCDGTSNICLNVTQVLLDPYNTFVINNFVLYHCAIFPAVEKASAEDQKSIILTTNPVDPTGQKILPGSVEIAGVWSRYVLANNPDGDLMGIAVVIDISINKVVGVAHVKSPKWGLFGSQTRLSVLKDLKADLLKIPEINSVLNSSKDPIDTLKEANLRDPVCGIDSLQKTLYSQIRSNQRECGLTNSITNYYRKKE